MASTPVGSLRFPGREEQRVIYDVMRDHFHDSLEQGEAGSGSFMDETACFFLAFEEGGLAPVPVALLSRTALYDAVQLHKVKDLSPEDFLA